MKKREFIKTMALAGLSLPLSSFGAGILNRRYEEGQPGGDDYWTALRQQYMLRPDFINLENGYYSMMALPVLTAYTEHVRILNSEGSHYMRTKMSTDKQRARQALADFLECPVDEVIITRNTTESTATVINGIDWKKGDEAIMAVQDYGSMLDMFKQLEKRHGIRNVKISIPNNPKTDEEIVALYRNAITPKTKLILVSHMINITGQILPVRKICQAARQKGVKVLVDGAHAVGHFEFRISDLGCDFYAASLHKWLGAPLGCGLLFVKKEHVKSLWPLYADSSYADDDIRKLNHTGTQPMAVELGMMDAIEFHKSIGSKRKEERLRFLQDYWTSKVRNIPGILVNTPEDPARHCAIGNVRIAKMKPADMASTLMDKYHIWTVAIDTPAVQGVRITPHVYTTTEELDQLVNALKEMNG